MNDTDIQMKENLKENKEGEPVVIEAVEIDCMDENVRVGKKVAKVGVAGSAVTVPEGGNTELYPIDERTNMDEASFYIYGWANSFAKRFGVTATSSAHPECAAVGAQGSPASELSAITEELAVKHMTKFAGKLMMSKDPAKVPNADYSSWFNRDPGKPHPAWAVVVTGDGAMLGEEIENIEGDKGEVFVVSGDWVKYALDKGFDRKKSVKALLFQLKLAYSIAEGVRSNPDPFIMFNAGRLDPSEVSENTKVIEEVFRTAKQEISSGHWKAASHH